MSVGDYDQTHKPTMSGTFGRTIRDFSKSRLGQELLGKYFCFEEFPSPQPSEEIPFNGHVDPNLVGTTVEQMLVLLVEHQNRGFRFTKTCLDHLRDGRSRDARAIKSYITTGEITDVLLDYLIRSGARRHRSFSASRTVRKPRPSAVLRDELRRIYASAIQFDWTVRRFFYSGFLTSSTLVTAQADLILDSMLVEVKTVMDPKHHSEHVFQLLAYYLVAQAPVKKPHDFQIDRLGLFYPKQSQFLECQVSQLTRFPLARLQRTAFDFLVEFQQWRDCPNSAGCSESSIEPRRMIGLRHLLMDVRPQLPWMVRAIKAGVNAKRIEIPIDFLLVE